MAERFALKFADGSRGASASSGVSIRAFAQLAWALGALGVDAPATRELAASLDEARRESPKAFHGVGLVARSRAFAHYSSLKEGEAALLAHNWMTATGRGPYAKADEGTRAAAKARFGEIDWGDDEKRRVKSFGLPELGADEAAFLRDGENFWSLGMDAPCSPTSDPQKVALLDAAGVDRVERLKERLGLWAALYAKAAAEWRGTGLKAPKDPFSKALAGLEGGRWEAPDSVESLAKGTLWIAVVDRPGRLEFLSPNGSSMREMSRAKTFGDSAEALEWARRHGGDAALEIAWTASSSISAHGKPTPALAAMFASKEAEGLAGAIGEAPAAARRPKGRSL